MNPLVSVIVPIYNVEKYIHKCVKSILNQTYFNLEIILVNDGSPDNCLEICEKFESSDNRVKVINKKNGGLSDARNIGILNSEGKYLMFLDGDDYIELKLIEKAVKEMEASLSDVMIWGYYAEFVDESEKIVGLVEHKNLSGTYTKRNFNDIEVNSKMVGLLGYAWNKMYSAELIKNNNFKFTKGLSLVEDIVFNSPVLIKSNKISFIEDPLVHYMQRPRTTLGSNFYNNYFELKKLAVSSVDNILTHWKIESKTRNNVISNMEFDSLKFYARMVATASKLSSLEKKVLINEMLISTTAKKTLSSVQIKTSKNLFIKYLMQRKKVNILLKLYIR